LIRIDDPSQTGCDPLMQVLYLVGLVWGEVQFICMISDPSLATFQLTTYNLLYTVYCSSA
jgi:hypothetical protein